MHFKPPKYCLRSSFSGRAMSYWPPHDLDIARIQDDIRALDPSDRGEAYARLSQYYGVSESTVRRVIPVGGRKTRVDQGASKAVISADAEAVIRDERKLSPRGLVATLEAEGAISPGTLSPAQAQRIATGQTSVRAPVPAPKKKNTPLSFKAWCKRHVRIREQRFSLSGHEYLSEIYEALENEPYVVFRKAAQVGISTAVILNTLWQCDAYRQKAVYYLPTDEEAGDFSDDRVNVIIDDSEHLSEIVGERGARGRENVGLRHVGRGSHYVRGMYTKKRVKSIDADIVVMDEIDEANQENRRFATDRVRHSALQHVRELSQPSIPGYGIDAIFAHSDQRYFHLICPECGETTCMDHHLSDAPVPVPEAFLPAPQGASWTKPDQKYYRACIHCEAPLDMSCGEWIPQNPDARIRGYHVSALYSQICSPSFADPADEIMAVLCEAHTAIERRHVTISILGLPYGGGKSEVDAEVFERAAGPEGLGSGGYYMGIDQGDTLHIVVADRDFRITGLYITDSWDEVMEIYERHGCRVLVGDAMPEKSQMKALARAVSARGGAGYICYYGGQGMKVGEEDDDVMKITADRTESLDETVRMLVESEIALPNRDRLLTDELFTWETFVAQVGNLKRRLVEDSKGVARWEYLKGVPNHFGMALNYARLAHDVGGATPEVFSVVTKSYRDVRIRSHRGDGHMPAPASDYGALPVGVGDYDYWY